MALNNVTTRVAFIYWPTLFSGLDDSRTGLANWIDVDLWTTRAIKITNHNDDSNKHPSKTGLTQKFQL